VNEDPANEENPVMNEELTGAQKPEHSEAASVDETERLTAELQEANDKYLRLYAEFENFKKRVSRDKEELIKYGNEQLIAELLPVIDHLEMALDHASNDVASGLVQGVEITLRELKKTLRKFGLTEIEAEGKSFDPLIHHAMAQVERDDVDENMVVEEYRKGYMLNDKVIRAAMVAVSKKPAEEDIKEKEIHIKEEE
jgi:molecular chaperone GrpE